MPVPVLVPVPGMGDDKYTLNRFTVAISIWIKNVRYDLSGTGRGTGRWPGHGYEVKVRKCSERYGMTDIRAKGSCKRRKEWL